MTLDEGIRKITFEPARKLGLGGRGLVKDGYFADLVGFKGTGITFVAVNGRLVVRDGEFLGGLNGKILRRQ